jgi:hypothetical protein
MGGILRKLQVPDQTWTQAELQNNPNLGGACGEIHAMINKGKKLFNPLGKLFCLYPVGQQLIHSCGSEL